MFWLRCKKRQKNGSAVGSVAQIREEISDGNSADHRMKDIEQALKKAEK